jgi:uncharacterized membrane protein YraQ (UPF0718 family)
MTTLALGHWMRGIAADRVVAAAAALVAVLFVVTPGQAVESLRFTVEALLQISPFLLVSVLLAGAIKAAGLDKQIARVFAAGSCRAIIAASLFGALSPFCSCGVIPLIAALLRAGVPLAPVMAFWISSPIMDPEMFILTAAVFGLPFATAKALAAIGMGVLGGYVTLAVFGRRDLGSLLKEQVVGASCAGDLKSERVVWTFWRDAARMSEFAAEARATGWFLAKWLTLAFVLESLMVAYLPAEAVGAWVGGGNWWAIPAAVIIGIPAYLNGYAAIPTVSGLMGLGMTPGAAIAFMIAGAATCIPAVVAVAALVRTSVFVLYVGLGAAGALAAGLAYGGLADIWPILAP